MATNKGKTGIKQTTSYTPSTKTIKVIDPKTGKPYMYDKVYDAIFDYSGNQLDSDDFRHIREVLNTGKDIEYSKLVTKKRQELKNNGITSEFAEVYRAGDSEKAMRLLNRAFNYYDGTSTSDRVSDKKSLDLIKELAERDNIASSTTYKESPLLWSLGMPAKKENEDPFYGVWGISEHRPSRNSENYPYYFTPIADIENPSEERKQIISDLINQGLKKYVKNTTVDSKGKIHSEYENKSITLTDYGWVGNMGEMGGSVSRDSSYFSFHDLWNLDPNASHNIPTFLPKAVYRKILKSAGVPESEQEAMITGFLRGDSASEILGFSPKGFKKGVPIYDRIYKDPVSGKTIKEMLKHNTYAYGGKVKKYANGGKLPIDMYGRSVSKYADGGFSSANRAPNPVILSSLPAGTIQDLEYQKYLAKINSDGIEKVAQSPGLLSTKSSSTTGDAVGAIGGIAGGFLSSAGTKQVEKGRMVGGTAMQAAGAVAPIATNPALLAATGGLSALAIPLAAGIGALAGIPKQHKYNRIEKGNDIEEQLAMYQGMDTQNNYMQDSIRYAAYGGKINHYDNGTPGITYDQEGGHISPVEIVGQKIHKAISANIFADLIEAMNAPKKGKTKSMEQTLKDVLYGYNNPTFVDKSKGYESTFYGDNNYTMTNRWAPQQAAYGGQFPGGELAQVESGETFSHGGTLHSVKTKSKHKDLPENLANQFLPNNSTVYSSIPIKNIKDILPIAKQFGLNTDLTAVKLYAGEVKNGTTVADLSKKGYKKLQPKKDLGNQFYTKADLRNTKYFEEGLTALGEVLNPETYRNIANNEYAQGQQGIQQILHAAYGGKVNHYAYGIGDPEDEPGYRSGSSSWAGAPGAGLRDAQYPPEILNPSVRVDIPKPLIPDYSQERNQFPHYYDGTSYERDKQETAGPMYRGYNRGNGVDYPGTTYQPPSSLQNGTGLPASAYLPPTADTPTTPDMVMPPYFNSEVRDVPYPRVPGNPQQEYTPADAAIGWASRQGYYDPNKAAFTAEGKGFAENFIKTLMGTKQDSNTTANKKSPYKLSPADIAALGVTGANAAASLLTQMQSGYPIVKADRAGTYRQIGQMPTEPIQNATGGALRAAIQASLTKNSPNNIARIADLTANTIAQTNDPLLKILGQNIALLNSKNQQIQALDNTDAANLSIKLKDDTALGNYKLSAIGENLLKMASNGNTRAAENALAQMDDATLRAMLVTIGPNSKYFTEQIERIINSRKGVIQSDKKSV